MRRSTMLCAPLLALALLAGCDQGGDPGDLLRADSDSGTSPVHDAPDGRTADTTDRPGRGGDPSCLRGSWEPADMSEFGVDAIESLGGTFDFTMSFDDGTVSIDVASTVPVTEYTDAMDMTVAFEGSYSVSGSSITLKDLLGSITIDGQTQPSSDGPGFGSLDEGTSSFTCSGDTLTLDDETFSRK